MQKSKFGVFFLLCLLPLLCVEKIKAADENSENLKDEHSKEMTVLEDLQAQIIELKQCRLRDKRRIESLEKEIKAPPNLRVQERSQIENVVTTLLEKFKLEQKSEIQKLKDRFKSLGKKLLLLGNELMTDDWILQPLVGPPGEKGQSGAPGEIPTGQLININQTLENLTNSVQILKLDNPKSCDEINEMLTSGQVKRKIDLNGQEKAVLCDFEADGGGWTLIQKRNSGPKEEFYRRWADYEDGFGSLNGNFWIGLKWIHALTIDRDQELRIDLWDFEDGHVYAKYSNFSVSDSLDDYRLSIDGYSGTAGDSMTPGEDNLHRMKFSTKDKDNDKWSNSCAANNRKGGWWYNYCSNSNLNGFYFENGETPDPSYSGMFWYDWKNSYRSLKKVEMKIRKRR